jgi:acetyltransferase-like isoleucine patch superfamily enzyme
MVSGAFNMLNELIKRIKYWHESDRIGPDIPVTQWRLYFKSTMIRLCKRKFKYFHETADFRPGAYAVGCSAISIGRRVVIRPATMLFADARKNGIGITIEDDVLMGSGIHIYVTTHRFDNPNIPLIDQGYRESLGVTLKKGCWIGANSIILPGVMIGENAVVGAGSIVTKNIPARTLAVGNPAKVIRTIG